MKLRSAYVTRRGLLSAGGLGLAGLWVGAPAVHAVPTVRQFVERALSVQGFPYGYGQAGPDRFDAAGLVHWALKQTGLEFPRGSREQITHCDSLTVDKAITTYGAVLYQFGHVGISLGDGRSVEARGAEGVGIFNAYSVSWTAGGRVSKLNYAPTQVAAAKGGDDGRIPESGRWGTATTRRLQEVLGVPADGLVISQNAHWQLQNPGLTSGWEWISENIASGAPVIREMQKRLSTTPDGLIGPDTIKAMQTHFQTAFVDGVLSEKSLVITALQKSLNAGHF